MPKIKDTTKSWRNSRKERSQWTMKNCIEDRSNTQPLVMQKKEERDAKMHKQVISIIDQLYDFNHSDYKPVKSKAYLRVVENKDFGKNSQLRATREGEEGHRD
jgi:TPP-dependent pyruvate/acetoin dehydrogenase alpha subunit